ncbi:MAG TPA: Gfo/Idh/MocA family oxidoreductase [Chloroflexaceae bacterium]|nr:Gfo/Idh/MocA family oxidoreductase [Chloroflexaceae bacterium]
MDRPLRMIVAGAGAMGRAWLQALAADRRWEVAALADISPEALGEAGAAFGVPEERRFLSAEAALEHTPADAALVVTPPETHSAVSVAALARGLPVLSEKPLGASLREGVAVLSAARRSGAPLMVGQGRRWLPHIVALRDAVAGGLIGELGYVTCQFRIPVRFGGWRETMPEVLIEDLAIHHFDTIRFVTGRNGERVFAHSFRPAWSWFSGNACAAVDLKLAGGVPVQYFGSWVARGPRSSWDGELIVVGSEGALLLRADETVWHYAGEDEAPQPVPLPAIEPAGLARGLDLFTRALGGEATLEPDGEDNIHSLALTSAAVASSRTGQPVEVDAHLRAAGWNPRAVERRA